MNDWAGFAKAIDRIDPDRQFFKPETDGWKYIVNQHQLDAFTAAGYDPDDFLLSGHLPEHTMLQVRPVDLDPTGMEDDIGEHRRFLAQLGQARAEALIRQSVTPPYDYSHARVTGGGFAFNMGTV